MGYMVNGNTFCNEGSTPVRMLENFHYNNSRSDTCFEIKSLGATLKA